VTKGRQNQYQNAGRVEAELQQMAATDPLTNLYNRRRFFELGQREFDRAVRYHRPLTALMLDLDHFKAICGPQAHRRRVFA
jgi:diguanylate cyclase (GGDEF)-like protein